MSLETIIEKIRSDAGAEVEKILEDHRAKARAIKEEAEKAAAAQAADILKDAEREGRLEGGRILTRARLDRQIALLEARQSLVTEVMDKAFAGKLPKEGKLKRKIILKDGVREEEFSRDRLMEEMRPNLENEIVEILEV
jgi:vacuolar-type H+-ATPase subunit H